MKKCPFCAEEIQDEAIKCRYCNEFLAERRPPPPAAPAAGEGLPGKKDVRWCFKTPALVMGFLIAGPLMLPLVWFHPRWSAVKKVVITLVVLLISWWIFKMTMNSIHVLKNYYGMLSGLG